MALGFLPISCLWNASKTAEKTLQEVEVTQVWEATNGVGVQWGYRIKLIELIELSPLT